MTTMLQRIVKNSARKGVGVFVFATVLASGCSTNRAPQYEWGSYEKFVYQTYHAPHKATPEIQIEKLGMEIQQIESGTGIVAPGMYAHLGYMYFLLAQFEMAEVNFDKELALYPESATLINRLKSGLEKNRMRL